MKKFLPIISVLIIAVFSTQTAAAQNVAASDAEIREKVKIAFEKALKYEYPSFSEIRIYGEKLIPFIEPYLDSPNETVRLLALDEIKDFKVPENIPLLIKALGDPSNFRAASQYLYDNFDHQTLARDSRVGDALRASAANGNTSLAAIILLGYFPGGDTETTLLSIRQRKDVRYWTDNREIGFAADIVSTVPVYLSLFRLDNQKYFQPFSDAVKKASSGEIEFLLYTLEYIDDPTLLKMIFAKGIVSRKILESEYGIEGGLMPGALRIGDVTINQFAKKLNLNLGFKLRETRYAPGKFNLARQKITAALNDLSAKLLKI